MFAQPERQGGREFGRIPQRDNFTGRLEAIDSRFTGGCAARSVITRRIAVPRVIRRSFTRAFRRTELWNGNTEGWNILRPDSIIRFAWTAWPKYGQRYEELIATGEFGNVAWVRLRTPREIRRWADNLHA